MIVSIIAAMTEGDRGIGLRGGLPWRLPADMSRFRNLTMGHPVIMGRTTWEPIAKSGLEGRYVIVVTRSDRRWETADDVASSLSAALLKAEKATKEREIFIAGGAQVYREALQRTLVDRMYLTLVHASLEADTFFPEYDEAEWSMIESAVHAADKRNPHRMTFYLLERKTS